MTPGTIKITTQGPEYGEQQFVAARIWIRSDANAKTNIEWLQNAIKASSGPCPFALAAEIIRTGGDIWLSIFPYPVDIPDSGPEWNIKWHHDSFLWSLISPPNIT